MKITRENIKYLGFILSDSDKFIETYNLLIPESNGQVTIFFIDDEVHGTSSINGKAGDSIDNDTTFAKLNKIISDIKEKAKTKDKSDITVYKLKKIGFIRDYANRYKLWFSEDFKIVVDLKNPVSVFLLNEDWENDNVINLPITKMDKLKSFIKSLC